MKYYELENICNDWKGKVCIFCAGSIGRSWGYDIIRAAGFNVDFYCDNNIKHGVLIRDGILTISLEDLFSHKEKVLVFIATVEGRHAEIKRQLENNGIKHIIMIGYLFMQEIIESVLGQKDDVVFERYKNIVDDRTFVEEQFEFYNGYPLDLEHPKTFNEKLQWLKLYNYVPEYSQLVDKFEMKKYIDKTVGEGYTIPTLGIWSSFRDINFDELPEKFILKCTHDSGSIVICEDKREFDIENARYILEHRLQFNYFWAGREWPYKTVKRRIIAERYLSDGLGEGLMDYKVFCFNGIAQMIQVDFDRFVSHKRNIYSRQWDYIPLMIKYPTVPKRKIEKPRCLKEMIEIAESISTSIPHVRVDFYIINDKPIVGELTFFHGGGQEKFVPEEWNYKFGEMIKLGKE